MKPIAARSGFFIPSSHAMVALVSATLLLSDNAALAQTPAATQPATTTTATTPPAETPDAPKIPNDELDSLVAPIALYPDPLLAQTLAACTYPLEVIQLKQWMDKNKSLKGKALTDAVAKQPWDPSIQSMAAVPDAVERLASNIQWTTDIGNAFLSQQQDVLDAVQRMRAKAQTKGTLKTSKEQVVQTKAENNKEVIVIQQANPETVYVPSYDPAVVYGPPVYPYYPYTYPGYYPGMGLAFGTGIILGAGIANNWWGNCNWGGGDININNNNNFNRNNINNINRNDINRNNVNRNNNSWQHNSNHRGPAPYSNRKTSEKFGGNDRGGANSNRPGGDRNRPSQQPSNRPGGDRTNANRPGGDRSNANRPTTRPSNPSANRPSTRPSGGDRVSNNRMSHSPSPRSNSAFSSGGGFSRSSASSSFSRGSSSMGGSRGGGMSRGGGSRGGGRRR